MTRRLPQLLEWAAQALGRSQPAAADADTDSAASERHRILRVALRDTLKQNGVSGSWIGFDTRVRHRGTPEPRLEVRLMIRQWNPGLVLGTMALQEEFKARLEALDPTSTDWMTGVSWQFALPEGADYPEIEVSLATPASTPAARESALRGTTTHRDVHEDLRRLFDQPHNAPMSDVAFAATVPAALH